MSGGARLGSPREPLPLIGPVGEIVGRFGLAEGINDDDSTGDRARDIAAGYPESDRWEVTLTIYAELSGWIVGAGRGESSRVILEDFGLDLAGGGNLGDDSRGEGGNSDSSSNGGHGSWSVGC